MKVLLVNIKSKTESYKKFVPLSLLKLSTLYRNLGHEVEYIEAGSNPTIEPDIICFSTIFLFNVNREIGFIRAYKKMFPKAQIRIGGISATLRPDLFRDNVPGAEVHVGPDPALDLQAPDYTTIKTEYSFGFTTRGCVNICKWCVVPKIEGRPTFDEGWRRYLGPHDLFISMDNNVFAAGDEWLESIMIEMSKRNMRVDFNQALDAVLFVKNPKLAEVLGKYKKNLDCIRFAWDSHRQDKFIEETIDIKEKYITKGYAIFYVLYGYKDSFEDVYNRTRLLLERGQAVKLMRYRDIETGKFSAAWGGDDDLLARFLGASSPSGMLCGSFNRKQMGSSFEEFKRLARASANYTKATGQAVSSDIYDELVKSSKSL